MPITVEVWSDVVCPWCYIGKRRFEKGLAAFERRDEVVLTYRSFELTPDTPTDFTGNVVDYLTKNKGITREQAQGMLEHVTGLAADEGLHYRFDQAQHANTRRAHELMHFAKANGKQLDACEALFRAYFIEGRHIGQLETLGDIAAEVGLDRAAAVAALQSGEFVAAVDADLDQARRYGISGVPFYVIDGKLGVSGAQNPETFTAALQQATQA